MPRISQLLFCVLLTLASLSPAAGASSSSTCATLPQDPFALPETLREASDGQTEIRVALVIGNSQYLEITSLPNPKRDAVAVTESLLRLGFRTHMLIDATAEAIADCQREISTRYPNVDIGVLYYAGHGIQIDDVNYLLGVDASENEGAAGLVHLGQLLEGLRANWKATLIFLDACRDNPYGDEKPQGLSPSTARGAVRVVHEGQLVEGPQVQASGTFIAYSTSPNSTATDGSGDLSPFAEAFARGLPTPGTSIQEVMANVSRDVSEATNWQQTPWTRSSLAVSLKLAGPLTRTEVTTLSGLWAAKSRDHLEGGNRSAAILDALKGIPVTVGGAAFAGAEYDQAYVALENAFRSIVVQADIGSVDSVDFSPDRSRMLVVRSNAPRGMRLELWDAGSGTLIKEIFRFEGDDSWRLSLVPPAFSHDGSRFASILGGPKIGVWNSDDGSEVTILDTGGEGPVSLNSDGTLLAVGGEDLVGKVFRVQTSEEMFRFDDQFVEIALYPSDGGVAPLPSKAQCSGEASFTRGDEILLYTSCISPFVDSRYWFLNLGTRKTSGMIRMQPGFVTSTQRGYSYSLSPDARYLGVHGYDNVSNSTKVHIFEVATSRVTAEVQEAAGGIAFSSSENVLAIVLENDIRFIDAQDGSLIDTSRYLSSKNFHHAPSLFSLNGQRMGVDYGDAAAPIWKEAIPVGELLAHAEASLSAEERDQLTRGRIRYWEPGDR